MTDEQILANMQTPRGDLYERFCALESSEQLIEWLDSAYPEKCPTPGQSIDSIWVEAGQREVVRLLRTFQNARDEDIAEANSKNSSIQGDT